MSFDAERQVIETRFEANWSATPVRYPNVKFSTKDQTEFVAIQHIPDDKMEKSLGTDPVQYRSYGDIVVQIFVKPNSGAARALQLADLVADVWRSAKFSGITVMAPRVAIVGVIEGWYQVDVISPYYRDTYELRSVI
ncbi:MAG: phage tail terminator-like protein [Acidimicrobiia bacterium]|nr:phage tail terminator-like protein [Acidimicrobiia bacterium]